MAGITKEQTKEIIRNTVKSFIILFLSSLIFVLIITVFPLMGSLTVDNFPIQQVIADNLKLLYPLLLVSILISPLLGWAGFKLIKKRVIKLLIIGTCGCWLVIIFVMIMWSGPGIFKTNPGSALFLSVWALIAYSFISIPILVPAILLIEKWTRKTSGITK